MPVVLVLAALTILAGVVVVAVGRGGELARFRADAAPYGPQLATAADVAAYRPPLAFFGYSARATDEALQRIAAEVAERDAELAQLRSQLAALAPEDGPPGVNVHSLRADAPGGSGDTVRPAGPAGPDAGR